MKQWTRLMVLLSVPALVWGCKSDPTVPENTGVGVKLVASPSTVFITNADSEAVSVSLTDANGNPVPADISFTQPADPNFTVRLDTTQGLIYNAEGVLVPPTVTTVARFIVAANGLAASSFDVSAGGFTTTVKITSTPTGLPDASVSSLTPALGAPVTITAPAGLTFAPGATITSGTILANTGAALTFLPAPGFAGPDTVKGVVPAYAPTLNLNLATSVITVGPASSVVKIPGTDALGTAPVLTIPAAGVDTSFIDAPPFGFGSGCTSDLGDLCNVYKITVAAPTTFHLRLDYDNTADMGAYFLDATGTAVDASVGFADAGGLVAGPEESDITLEAGTYYLAVVRFTYGATDPGYYQVTLTGQ